MREKLIGWSHSAMAQADGIALAILLSVAAVIAHQYFYRELMPLTQRHLNVHLSVISGTAMSPNRYRILVPYVNEILMGALSGILSPRRAFLLTYGAYHFSSIFLILVLLYFYLKQWFSRERALIGVLVIGATMPIAVTVFQPWSYLEAAFFIIALLFIYRNQYRALFPVIVLAALNRETGIFIPLAFILVNLGEIWVFRGQARSLRLVGLSAAYLGTGVAILLLLRCILGWAPQLLTLQETFAMNTTVLALTTAAVNVTLFLGAFWVFAFLGFGRAPSFCRRTALVIPFYLLAVLAWGVWTEVRLLMILYPLVAPLALAFAQPAPKDG